MDKSFKFLITFPKQSQNSREAVTESGTPATVQHFTYFKVNRMNFVVGKLTVINDTI